jgi:tRNA dimethylallyltransferase
MLRHGFIDEVQVLKRRRDLSPDLPSMRCVGYRQAWRYLDGVGTLAEFRLTAIAATRQLAKRQMTWLRSLAADRVVDPRHDDVLGLLAQRLNALDAE